MNHRFQCQCGALQGEISQAQRAVRGVCYCKDCRTYSNYLGKKSQIHDALGGFEFVATLVNRVSFTRGSENLACLSLSPRGSLRWYAKCCNTPICNTSREPKVPYVGLVHSCLKADPGAYERSFPQIQARVNTKGAFGPPPRLGFRTFTTLLGFIPRVMIGRLSGAYKKTPFFSTEGSPIVEVKVLSKAERENASSDS